MAGATGQWGSRSGNKHWSQQFSSISDERLTLGTELRLPIDEMKVRVGVGNQCPVLPGSEAVDLRSRAEAHSAVQTSIRPSHPLT